MKTDKDWLRKTLRNVLAEKDESMTHDKEPNPKYVLVWIMRDGTMVKDAFNNLDEARRAWIELRVSGYRAYIKKYRKEGEA